MKITDKYVFFFGEDDFSNFSPHTVNAENETFKTGEHYFHWLKAMYFNDSRSAFDIFYSQTARKAKELGRKVRNFNTREWDQVKSQEMMKVLKAKIESNPELKEKFLQLGKDHHFVEASPFDRSWGIGYNSKNATKNIDDWGENLLGKCWDELYKQYTNK